MSTMIAALCRFYGWSWSSVLDMPMDDFMEAAKGMEALSNQETLRNLKIQDWPSMKSDDRKAFHKDISKKAGIKKKTVSMDSIDKILGGF